MKLLKFTMFVTCTTIVFGISAPNAVAETPETLYSFCSQQNCTDGAYPVGGVTRGNDGALYGTTAEGGANNDGVVFALFPAGNSYTFNVVYNFCGQANCADGSLPVDAPIVDQNGNLFGVTPSGGVHQSGIVYELKPNPNRSAYTFIDLYDFCSQKSCSDGIDPVSTLTYAGADAGVPYDGLSPLYGATQQGGILNSGLVFQLTLINGQTQRQLSVVHSFCGRQNCPDGIAPNGVIADSAANLYGTTRSGGKESNGTLFQLNSADSYSETVLYNFCKHPDCSDGSKPAAPPARDKKGALFGTVASGGRGWGALYKTKPSGGAKILHSFCDAPTGCPSGREGENPNAGVVVGPHGNVYGTVQYGGANGGGGTIYEFGRSGFRVIYSFCSQLCDDGDTPGPVILGPKSTLFGTTQVNGGHDGGNVFRVKIQN
ncbi:MAG TPA: choice-of-anchor tandem repeat GloVer-containing protein [Rhizomicrobium sp.]|jgi:uncharacterized repeat protein (TIGR03803 family)|nr:choice-of-anchor tandem repeat GloVer-containing protein [Rhizomicrobium sp.]